MIVPINQLIDTYSSGWFGSEIYSFEKYYLWYYCFINC